VGLASGGVPVGVQLIGRLGDERTLLAAAAAVARTSPFVSLAPLS
jgi:Asp-tRNA(Asn)/Glu-tRNA(Gln) amidotransferase A subunit family amidase